MTNEVAVHILKNAAWIGTVKDLLEIEEAIETLAGLTWITDRHPDPDTIVPITVSGTIRNITYDHALMLGSYGPDGWYIEGIEEEDMGKLKVHAWYDLEPYEQS